ncbi:MAG: energy transducer TonB [Pseudomonadota bacterium]
MAPIRHLALVACIVLAPIAVAEPDPVEDIITGAFEALKAGNNEQAMALLQTAYEDALEKPLTEQVTPVIDATFLALEMGEDEFANKMINHVLNSYEADYGKQSQELIDVALEMGERLNYGAKRALANYALTISQKAHATDRMAHARTEIRAGRILADDSASQEEARELLTATVKAIETQYGKDATELIPALMALGHANVGLFNNRFENNSSKRRRVYSRAVKIAEKSGDAMLHAKTLFDAGEQLLMGNSDRAMVYMHKSFDAYTALMGPTHPEAGMVALRIASVHADEAAGGRRKHMKDMRRYAEHAIEGLRTSDTHREEHISALGILARYYERREKHDDATPYVLEIDRIRGEMNGGDADPHPLQQVLFARPSSLANSRVKGTVSVEFVIDEEGFVRDFTITASDVYKSVQTEVRRTVERWRYAPKMSGGKPVKDIVTATFPFDWERPRRIF